MSRRIDKVVGIGTCTGAIYRQGAVRAMHKGREAGRGYLELTGYWKPLRM